MLVFSSHPDLTGVPRPAIPAVTVAAVAHPIPCADESVVLITLSVVTLTILPRDPPILRRSRADTPATVARPFSIAHDSIGGLTQLFALSVSHFACPRERAQLPKPAVTTDTPAA